MGYNRGTMGMGGGKKFEYILIHFLQPASIFVSHACMSCHMPQNWSYMPEPVSKIHHNSFPSHEKTILKKTSLKKKKWCQEKGRLTRGWSLHKAVSKNVARRWCWPKNICM